MFLRQSEGTKNSAKDDKKGVTKAGNTFFMIFINVIILNVVFSYKWCLFLSEKYFVWKLFANSYFPTYNSKLLLILEDEKNCQPIWSG